MEPRYAIYLVVVEDTEENDMLVGGTASLTFDRVGGDLSQDDALAYVMEHETLNYDRADD